MRCLASLALALLVLEAAFTQVPANNAPDMIPMQSAEDSPSNELHCNTEPCETDANCRQGTKCYRHAVCGNICIPLSMVHNMQSMMVCTKDSHCLNNMKCCSNFCALSCQDSVAENPSQ